MREVDPNEALEIMKKNFPEKYAEVTGRAEQENADENKTEIAAQEIQEKEANVEEQEQEKQDVASGFVNPFAETQNVEKSTEPTQDMAALQAQIEELNAELNSYAELMDNDYVRFALEAKESGKSFFEAVDEIRPKSVSDLTVEEIFEEQLKRYSKIDKWTEEDIEEERKAFEEMNKSQKRNHVSAFAKELESEFSNKTTEFKFDAKKEVISQKELKKAEARVITELGQNIQSEVNKLVSSGYLPEEQKQDFFSQIKEASNWIEFSPEGIPYPNTKIMLEYAWLKRTFNQEIQKAKEQGKKEALLEEKVNKTNVTEKVVRSVESKSTLEQKIAAASAMERL